MHLAAIGRVRRSVLFLAALCVAVICGAAVAAPADAAQRWRLDVLGNSTAQPGAPFSYSIETSNDGDANMDGTTIRYDVTLPAGLAVADPAGTQVFDSESLNLHPCTRPDLSPLQAGDTAIRCENAWPVLHHRGRFQKLTLKLAVDPGAEPGEVLTTEVSVSGGGAPTAATAHQVLVSPDLPGFGIDKFDGAVSADDGSAFTQAGGHPDLAATTVGLNAISGPPLTADFLVSPIFFPAEPVRNIAVDLPPGFVGNPNAADRCKASELAGKALGDLNECSTGAQVGRAMVMFKGLATAPWISKAAVYNMTPPNGVPARFGFKMLGTVVVLDAQVRSDGDYGLTVVSRNISEALATARAEVEFWGKPADPVHDLDRQCPGQPYPDNTSPFPNAADPACVDENGDPGYVRPPLKPLLRNPTACTAPGVGLTTTVHADSWFDSGAQTPDRRPDLSDPAWVSESFVSHEPDSFGPLTPGAPVGPENCGAVAFTPDIDIQPTSSRADSPTGLEVDLSIPQDSWDDPDSIAQSDLRNAVVTLPKGMTVNPSSADGLGACSQAQVGLDSTEPHQCPDASKIGTLSVDTPLLDHPVDGSVFLARQADNPFGTIMALYLVARDPETGVSIKLAGKVEGDSQGTLTTTFVNQPQLPFSNLHLELKSGPRAPLVNPGCGTHSSKATLTGWAGNAPAVVNNSFQVTQGPDGGACPSGFAPGFKAGLTSQIASSSSPFVLELSRRDGEQQLSSLSVRMPKGLAGKIAGVPFCAESLIPSGSCSAASKLGVVQAGAGSGPNTFYVPQGSVFLAGPYKGAPLSLVASVPAVAGPFNLGNVVVRSQLQVDRRSAQVTVVSDPLPQAVKGVALHLRDLYVAIDRDGFMSPPSSCDRTAVNASIGGIGGAVSRPSAPFQMLLCRSLEFDPKLSLRLTGKKQLRSTKHPGIRAQVTQTGGEAAIERAEVRLPKALVLDVDNADALCEYVDGTKPDLENHCPAGSVVGSARAVSPLLNRPLVGKVFFVKNVRIDPDTGRQIRTLPMIVAALRGEIPVNLAGESDVRGGRLISTFKGVPDAPISKFNLNITGGKSGILLVTKNRDGSTIDLCRSGRQTAVSQIDGHNGKPADTTITVKKPKCARKKRTPRLRLGAHKRKNTASRSR